MGTTESSLQWRPLKLIKDGLALIAERQKTIQKFSELQFNPTIYILKLVTATRIQTPSRQHLIAPLLTLT